MTPLKIKLNFFFLIFLFMFVKATLCKSSSSEAKVRQATKEIMREINMSEMLCLCRRPVVAVKSCWSCLLREICDRLSNLGYNSVICKSKWSSSSEIPSGAQLYKFYFMKF